MKRLLVPTTLVAAILLAAVFLPRAQQRVRPSVPACPDPAGCQAAAPAPVAATGLPAATPHVRVATTTAQASPAVAADGTALRAEADRLIAAGKVVEGIEVFRKAVEAAPTAQNHGDLGSLLYRLTAFEDAARHLRAAADLDPGNADRWIALANAYYRKVDPGQAWQAEARAREAEPGLALGRDAAGMRVRKGDTAPREP
jgi:tetratricopeptide (TPR) repeat protein